MTKTSQRRRRRTQSSRISLADFQRALSLYNHLSPPLSSTTSSDQLTRERSHVLRSVAATPRTIISDDSSSWIPSKHRHIVESRRTPRSWTAGTLRTTLRILELGRRSLPRIRERRHFLLQDGGELTSELHDPTPLRTPSLLGTPQLPDRGGCCRFFLPPLSGSLVTHRPPRRIYATPRSSEA